MSLINRFKNLLFSFLSILFIFLLLELIYRLFVDIKTSDTFTNRTLLYESGNNFENFDNFFKYVPNSSIRMAALYSKKSPISIDDIILVYDYSVLTNNAGLVMRQDLIVGDNVIFVIGDSFTEGQGASPWFYNLENRINIPNLKLVNLGILGTGPAQWIKLKNHISSNFQVNLKGSIINIIPHDMIRKSLIFNELQMSCLKRRECEYSLDFQGFQFKENMDKNEIKRSVLQSILTLPQPQFLIKNDQFFFNIKRLVKKSRVISDIYAYVKIYFPNKNILDNEQALFELKEISKNNIFINVVSQKRVNSNNYRQDYLAKKLIEFLENNDFKFSWCDIPIDGYFKIDSHPNKKGYEILRGCTERAITALGY